MKKRKRNYGFVGRKTVLCLMAAVLFAAAQPAAVSAEATAAADEEIVRYSEIYDTGAEVPEAPEFWTDPDGGQWRLKESRIFTVPLTGRTRKLSGEVVYPEVTRRSEIPLTAVMEVTDEESGRSLEAELPLLRTEYEKERWQPDLEVTVTFHSYGADSYRFGEVTVPHRSEEPPLAECREELYAQTGLSEEDCRFEVFSWAGEAYTDAGDILCRDAKVTGSRRVWDCRAVYEGETALPDVIRYRREMKYEPIPEVVQEEAVEGMAELPGEEAELSIWDRLFRSGLAVSVSLFLLLAAVLGFLHLRRLARKADEERGKN